jgi:hypothetical protein
MAAKVIDESEVPCYVTDWRGGIMYRCSKTGPHTEHEAQAPEYAHGVIDWKSAFGHARPVLEFISSNEKRFDERLVASARRALLFAQGKRLSAAPRPGLAKA